MDAVARVTGASHGLAGRWSDCLPGWCLRLDRDPILDRTCFKSGPLATPTGALIGGTFDGSLRSAIQSSSLSLVMCMLCKSGKEAGELNDEFAD